MNPIVPIIMALGAILFLIGVFVFFRLGMQRIRVVRLRGKEYKLWQFVVVTVGSGVALFMLSVLMQKHIPYQQESGQKPAQLVIPSNLQYELDSVLSSLSLNNSAMLNIISRFQKEYLAASQKGDKYAMDLLVLELSFHIRTELQDLEYPDHQIEREIERIMGILKQQSAASTGDK